MRFQSKMLNRQAEMHHGQIIEGEGYVRFSAPDSSEFRWANFVVFCDHPNADSAKNWKARAEAAQRENQLAHCAFTWDCPDLIEFPPEYDDAPEVNKLIVMRALNPPSARSAFQCRKLSKADWSQMPLQDHPAEDRAFWLRRVAALKNDSSVDVYGAFSGDELISVLQIDAMGSMEDVFTHAEFRRKNAASALIAYAAEQFFRAGGQALWLEAEHESAAFQLYQKLGFVEVERILSVAYF